MQGDNTINFEGYQFYDLALQYLPIFMWTRREIERFLPIGSVGREQAIKSIEHSFSTYDFYGNHIPHLSEKENLLHEIEKREIYIVDTNSASTRLFRSHPDKAFIICATLAHELPGSEKFIFNESHYKLGNLFEVGALINLGRVIIDRFDEPYKHAFDVQKFKEGLDKTSNLSAQQQHRYLTNKMIGKDEILTHLSALLLSPQDNASKFLQTGKACDMPSPHHVQHLVSKLISEIKTRVPECKHKLNKSFVTARRAYEALLLKDKVERTKFDDQAYDNVLGDMHVVCTAVFLGAKAKIITDDIRLKKMALENIGIECCGIADFH